MELVPENSDVWDGKSDVELIQLLKGIFKWAQQMNVQGVDFISTHSFASSLEAAGMREINEQYENKKLEVFL